MKIKFYGTRGSTPVCDKDFLEFGGNTTSIKITRDNGRIAIIDAGSGIRNLGKDLIKQGFNQDELFIGFTHFHWDHIQGFPFFSPAYLNKNKILIAICGLDNQCTDLYSIFSTQMQTDYFPVQLEKMGATFEFFQPVTNKYTGPDGNKWEFYKHNHPGGAYSYRLMADDKIFVYCSDIEHGDKIDSNVVSLARDADLLIHDAQYTPAELPLKSGWGHSSYEQAVEVANQANVKKLVLFHHDPDHNDEFLLNIERECQSIYTNSIFARDGMELEI